MEVILPRNKPLEPSNCGQLNAVDVSCDVAEDRCIVLLSLKGFFLRPHRFEAILDMASPPIAFKEKDIQTETIISARRAGFNLCPSFTNMQFN